MIMFTVNAQDTLLHFFFITEINTIKMKIF